MLTAESRKLTFDQHAKLDVVADNDPTAVVFGWERAGPLIERSDGRVQLCQVGGRLTPRKPRHEGDLP